MKKQIKQIGKLVTSRMFYLCLGLFFSLTIFVANATWDTKVSNGTALTSTLWNDVVSKLTEFDSWKSDVVSKLIGLDNKQLDCVSLNSSGSGVISCNSGYTMVGGGCVWGSTFENTTASPEVRSRPSGNGWECFNITGMISKKYVRCCKY